MLGKTPGIVLHSIKYGESGRVVKIYTESQGLVSFLIRSTVSKKRGSTMALYQPLTQLAIEYDHRDDKGLQHVRSVELHPDSTDYISNPIRGCVAMFVAEVFYKTLQEGEPAIELYAFLAETRAQVVSDPDMAWLPLTFLLELAEQLGLYPDLSSEGDILDLREGAFTHTPPLHGESLGPEIASILKTHHGMGFVASGARLDRATRRDLIEGLLLYFKIHIPHFKEVNSYPILKEIL